MAIKAFMDQFAKEMEIEEGFSTEVPGVYQIPIDEGVNIMVTEVGQGFLLKGDVAPPPKVQQGDYFALIMNANLLGKETHGNVLGLSEEGDTVVLTRHVEQEMKYKEFSYILEDFFNQVEFWKEETLNYGK